MGHERLIDRSTLPEGVRMKAVVDLTACIGCELCTSVCPDVFQMADDGLAHSIVDVVPSSSEDSAREAAESCPTNAINITE